MDDNARKPSLKQNVVVTYGSQLYMAIVGIVMLPFYVSALGIEAYGIVGLYVALQGWLALLDFGLSATLSREAARFRANVVQAAALRALFRTIVTIFAAMAAVGALTLMLGAATIVQHWLHTATLPGRVAITAIQIMALVLALRLIAIPLRSLLTGAEHLQWLAIVNVSVSTIRAVLVIPLMALFGATLEVFFTWQLASGILELLLLSIGVARVLPPTERGDGERVSVLREHLAFSLGVAATGAIWVAATNADKVILSGLLPLRDYSMFSIATTAAGGVLMMIAPFSAALGPRIVRVHAEGKPANLVHRYNQITQLTAAAAIPSALTLAFFARETLWAWTGRPEIAAAAATVLPLYALGNAILAIGALPVQLQLAAGRIRLQVIGTMLFAFVFLPTLWLATSRFGMNGAGAAWLGVDLLFFIVWLPFLHSRYLPERHVRWLRQVVTVALPTAVAAALFRVALPWPADRWLTLAELLAVGALLLAISCASTPALRNALGQSLEGIFQVRTR
jgi:O-antigen/teichoic acid export membrane protein